MPSVLHEVLRELFTTQPDLLATLLRGRVPLPEGGLCSVDTELTDPRMTQLLPDAVLASPSADAPQVIVIVEVHLQITEAKRRVWPQYSAAAYGRYGCPVELVVVTPSANVERWAQRPIQIGRGHTMTPEVLGPSAIPLLDGAEQVQRAPVMGMLATLSHLRDPGCAQQALWTLEALATYNDDADGRLADITFRGPAGRRARADGGTHANGQVRIPE